MKRNPTWGERFDDKGWIYTKKGRKVFWLPVRACLWIHWLDREGSFLIAHWTEKRFKAGDSIVTSEWCLLHGRGEKGTVVKTYGREGYMVNFEHGKSWVPRYRIKG